MPSIKRTANAKYITAGFSLVLLLMLGISLIGLQYMASIKGRVDAIAHELNAKTDLVFTMRHAARERLIVIQAMGMTDDLFARQEFEERFLEYAAEFTQSRERLTAMNLGARERELLAQQAALTAASVPLQREFIAMLAAGRNVQANALFLRSVLPAQNLVLNQLDELLAIQRQAAQQAAADASAFFWRAYLVMGALGVVALGLGIAVAWHVRRLVKRAQEALFHEKELAQITLHSIGDGVITTDAVGAVVYLNPIAERLTGWSLERAAGQPVGNVFKLKDAAQRAPDTEGGEADATDESTYNRRGVLVNRKEEFAVECTAAPIRDDGGHIVGNVLIFRDVTQAQFLTQQLGWQASHDALTNLDNRLEFERRLNLLLVTAKTHNRTHALLYIDLDQFKVVNDTCGHVAGDELLVQIAGVLKQRIRDNDVVARLGGDEFGVLLEGCPIERAREIAENLRAAVREFRFVWLDKFFEIGASIGVVAINAHTESLMKAMSLADAACYAAKDRGRNCVYVSEPDDRELAERHGQMQWLSHINKALAEDRFQLYYQAIADCKDGAFGHYEILLAMRQENGAIAPPMAFIPAAERYGMMGTIDRWVVSHVFARHAAQWRKLGANAAAPHGWTYAINLSGLSINDEQFLHFLRTQIDKYEVPPAALCFEITETAAITSLTKASRFMRELRALGCRFALDDFGSGMSSFAYLKNLPVDYLKIDGAFVRDMVQDPVDYAMVETINRIGHVLDLYTIAESVETPAILEAVRTLGVDYAQGYALHRPQLFDDLIVPPAISVRTG